MIPDTLMGTNEKEVHKSLKMINDCTEAFFTEARNLQKVWLNLTERDIIARHLTETSKRIAKAYISLNKLVGLDLDEHFVVAHNKLYSYLNKFVESPLTKSKDELVAPKTREEGDSPAGIWIKNSIKKENDAVMSPTSTKLHSLNLEVDLYSKRLPTNRQRSFTLPGFSSVANLRHSLPPQFTQPELNKPQESSKSEPELNNSQESSKSQTELNKPQPEPSKSLSRSKSNQSGPDAIGSMPPPTTMPPETKRAQFQSAKSFSLRNMKKELEHLNAILGDLEKKQQGQQNPEQTEKLLNEVTNAALHLKNDAVQLTQIVKEVPEEMDVIKKIEEMPIEEQNYMITLLLKEYEREGNLRQLLRAYFKQNPSEFLLTIMDDERDDLARFEGW